MRGYCYEKTKLYTYTGIVSRAMIAEGKTQREVAENFGLKDKYVVKELLKRQRRKQRKWEAEIPARPKGRPRKNAAPRDIVAESVYLASILQPNSSIRHYALHVKEGKSV